ncbi:hypothetical protein [Vibrio phage CKB-S1]|nr:hypothetical protein [Vibrio phage CKB-S1]
MARSSVTLSATRQLIASRRCVITILRTGRYEFNDTNSATAATLSYYRAGEQVVQTETKDTYARTPDGEGAVLVDQEG